jgi:hypothetical protein
MASSPANPGEPPKASKRKQIETFGLNYTMGMGFLDSGTRKRIQLTEKKRGRCGHL